MSIVSAARRSPGFNLRNNARAFFDDSLRTAVGSCPKHTVVGCCTPQINAKALARRSCVPRRLTAIPPPKAEIQRSVRLRRQQSAFAVCRCRLLSSSALTECGSVRPKRQRIALPVRDGSDAVQDEARQQEDRADQAGGLSDNSVRVCLKMTAFVARVI